MKNIIILSAIGMASFSMVACNNTNKTSSGNTKVIAGLGAVAGPLLGNLLKGNLKFNLLFGKLTLDKFSTPFVISSLLTLVVFVLYIFLLPESYQVPNKVKMQTSAKAKVPLMPGWKLLNKTFILLLTLSFISQLSLSMFEGTFALHSQRLFYLDHSK
ncbi:hypothetical protein [Mucilaginibacter sp. 5C4]|uniref:hypothetical protein n=1 Tax=Mucilaginibacter sp. 5C4 TaxID=3048589 RepID=UPI002AC9D8F5|nr:hypothetical protein [Mucilaginibacter sp. 5C4]MEB0303204.1 hypothetical protein [Mucilaginibacter sp. 5C4]WPX24121.1 hypothetical protein RHM67_02380 [Mucilaginibacter sp. 5C4]